MHKLIDVKRFFLFYACLIYLFLMTGCNTYKTYYGITEVDNFEKKRIDILRLDISYSQKPLGALENLQILKMLNLSGREEFAIHKILEAIPNPLALKILILDDASLETLPQSITRFENLEQLSLNENPQLNLQEVAQIIKDLPIEFLNFQANDLREIPRSIDELVMLEDLNLSNNKLFNFEHFDYLSSLKNLRSLWLTNNSLASLSKSLGSLQQLRNLYIEHNEISIFPEELIGMKNLGVLHAGHNQFTELSPTFALLPKLLLLHINNCSIRKIPSVFNHKKNYPILGLILDNNNLTKEMKIAYQKKFDHFFILSI